MLTIGQHLKDVRTGKNISVMSLSEKTKVNQGIILALENNEFEKLPPLTYLKFFMRSFSTVLNLSEDYLVDLLVKTYDQQSTAEVVATASRPLTQKKIFTHLLDAKSFIRYFLKSLMFKSLAVLGLIILSTFAVRNYIQNFKTSATAIDNYKLEKMRLAKNPHHKKYKVLITADKSPTWVTYRINKEKTKNLLLDKGENLNLSANNVNLILGNPKASRMYVNGKEVNLKLLSRASGIARVQLLESGPYLGEGAARSVAFIDEQ